MLNRKHEICTWLRKPGSGSSRLEETWSVTTSLQDYDHTDHTAYALRDARVDRGGPELRQARAALHMLSKPAERPPASAEAFQAYHKRALR